MFDSVPVTSLTEMRYGSRSTDRDGDVEDAAGDQVRFVGAGSLRWSTAALDPGEYAVALDCACPDGGVRVEVESDADSVGDEVRATDGYFPDASQNYERVALDEPLVVGPGDGSLRLRVEGAPASPALLFRALVLNPAAQRAAIERERTRAREARASTDWMADAGYGVMFHWTAQSQPRHGPQKSYTEAVTDFDVDAFADTVERTGADYVVFTLNHADPHCPAPVEAWERVHPGRTTDRDLVADVASALGERGVALVLYVAAHTLGNYPEAGPDEFAETLNEVVTEVGTRYGDDVVGYWFDGMYQCFEAYPEFSFEAFFESCKDGNRDRVVAHNSWLYPPLTEFQEYWAGEVGGTGTPFEGQCLDAMAGSGLQSHYLLLMEPYWVHSEPETEMADPRFEPSELASFVGDVNDRGGAVTVNLGIYQDGSVGGDALTVMEALRDAVQ